MFEVMLILDGVPVLLNQPSLPPIPPPPRRLGARWGPVGWGGIVHLHIQRGLCPALDGRSGLDGPGRCMTWLK